MRRDLYRIFFYDCPPLEKKLQNPISKRGVDFSKSREAIFRLELHDQLRDKRKVAVLIARDADFVPAAKLARREGVDFVWNPMWQAIPAGPPFLDTLLAQASRRVIVSVDRIVSTQTICRNNHLTKIPSSMVEAVVEAPYGAHPTASPSLYRADEEHLKEYVRSCASLEAFASYTERYVDAPGHIEYLNAIGGARLAGIAASETNLT